MTLDATKPTDVQAVSSHAGYQRETRAALNAIEAASANLVQTTLALPAGTTSISVGTELSSAMIEVINITAAAAITLTRIGGGTKGQVKIFIFGDGDIDLENSTDENNGEFRLNQLPAVTDYEAADNDILCLINVDGDPSGGVDGYWAEAFRTVFVG